MLQPPCRFLTLLAFCGGCVPRTILAGYMCRILPASQAFNFPGGGARWSPRCTYPLNLALEGNILDDCSITFPWSSARPLVSRVSLAPWRGPLRVRFAGGEGQVEGRVRVWRRPFSVAGGLRGLGKRGPRPGDVGGSRWIFVRVRHHGLLRLASTLWLSVARAGQVDVFLLPVCPTDRRCWSVLRRRALSGCTRGFSWARLARAGSSSLTVNSAAVGVTSMVGSSCGRR